MNIIEAARAMREGKKVRRETISLLGIAIVLCSWGLCVALGRIEQAIRILDDER